MSFVPRRAILTAIPRRSSTSTKLGERNWSSQTPAQNNVAGLRVALFLRPGQSFPIRQPVSVRHSFPEGAQSKAEARKFSRFGSFSASLSSVWN
ncbi:MAG: hypothetical protein DWH78_06755 [Planctomycetota bacterium]|nr:MAG: hypothetical protein DWH78_06755 [Planctomycetota bacterium]